MKRKKRRRKLKLKGLFIILVIIAILVMLVLYLFKMPIKNIKVNGNVLLSEGEIIRASKIDNSSSFIKTSGYTIKKRIKTLDLIDDVKIKKYLFGKVVINVKENKILFYNNNTKKTVLSNGKEIEAEEKSIGYPILINEVPKEIYQKFIKSLYDVKGEVLKMISEIEYSPNIYKDTIVDDERFILKTNDGNKIIINNVNMHKLNKYQQIYFGLTEKGTLYLDSSNDNYIFEKYK